MKTIYLISLFVLAYCTASSQAIFQNITYGEKLEPGLMLLVPNKVEVVENTILQKLQETGYKPQTKGSLFWKTNKENGFYVFKKVTLVDLQNQTLDLFFKVEKQKDNKKKSTLYMLVSKGYNNFVSPESDSAIYKASRRFLNGFIKETAAYKLNITIEDQKESLAVSQKKLKNLKDSNDNMQKKIEDLKIDSSKNKEEQQIMEGKIQEQQRLIDANVLKMSTLK